MNFKHFMYYCALCGGWAALLVWGVQEVMGFQNPDSWIYRRTTGFWRDALIGTLLGISLSGVIGLLDALLNSVGMVRIVRITMCVAVGAICSLVAASIGNLLAYTFKLGFKFPGWLLVGLVIGASIGIFDLLRALSAGKGLKQAIRKLANGIIGGTIGGFIGGIINDGLDMIPAPPGVSDRNGNPAQTLKDWLFRSSLALGLVILGMCIGLLIGVVQVVLKEAWVRIDKGFRSGREMILSKPETSIGRAEGVDIALFGDMQVEKKHARIVLKGDRYILIDDETPGGTTINGQRIYGPTPLSNGDLIGCGNSLVRFQEKTKR